MKNHWKLSRNSKIESLEGRDLLSADFGVQLGATVDVDSPAPIVCELPSTTSQINNQTTNDSASNQIQSELQQPPGLECTAEPDQAILLTPPSSPTNAPAGFYGTGFYGTIDTENPTKTFQFQSASESTVQVAVAGNFEGAVEMEVFDSDGDLVTRSRTEKLDGLKVLEFAEKPGENYQIRLTSESPNNEPFILTVGQVESPPVDLHANQIGSDSTDLRIGREAVEAEGEVGRKGDVDTFQFTPPTDGKVKISIDSLSSNQGVTAKVIDGEGNIVAQGIADYSIDFQVNAEEGMRYYIVLDSSTSGPSPYQLKVQQISAQSLPMPKIPLVDGKFELQNTIPDAEGTQQFQLEIPEKNPLSLAVRTLDGPIQVSLKSQTGELIAQGITGEAMKIETMVKKPEMVTLEVRSLGGAKLRYELAGSLDNPFSSNDEGFSLVANENRRFTTERSENLILDEIFRDRDYLDSMKS